MPGRSLAFAWLGLLAALPAATHAQDTPRVYRGATVLTAAQAEIPSADLVVRGTKIEAVGPTGQVAVPQGAEIIDVSGKVIIPGLVDTHSHIGVYGRPAVEANSDGNEATGPVQSGIRALDAIWPDDPGIRMALAGGLTTVNIMPGSANVIGGQTLYVKLRPGPVSAMMIEPGQPSGGLKMANGENPKRAYGSKNQAPGTRMKLAALQREQFIKAQDYRRKLLAHAEAQARGGEAAAKSKPPERDLALESLVEVLDRKRTVHFHSHRADDIMTVARLADEFGFEVVLQHGTEAYKVADELAKRKIPVSLTIPDSPGGKPEVAALTERNAALLHKAGVVVAVNTDDSVTESRFLLRTASIAVRGGLSEEEALRTLTVNPARMMHVESRVGSIEPGKDADFVVLSGRPFSVYTQVLQTFIEGQKRYDRATNGTDYIGGFALRDPAQRPKPADPVAAPTLPATPLAPAGQATPEGNVAIRAGRLHSVSGPPILDGLVLVENGRIRYVGPAAGVAIPPNTPVVTAAVATPGLIDAHTVVGASGGLNVPAVLDQDEQSDPNQADVRILDSFHPGESLLRFFLSRGVTTIQAFPGRVNVIAGQAGIFRTHGTTAESMTVRFPSALLINLGESVKGAYPNKAPSTRMAVASLIRNALVAAANDRAKRAAVPAGEPGPDRSLKLEALSKLLDRSLPTVFSAQRADDIETALRLAREFQLATVLDLVAEGYLVRQQIADAKVPVLVHPTMQRAGASIETMHSTLNNAALLADSGVPIAITSAFEAYVPRTRVILYEAAIAAVNGLGPERALRAITLDPARILQIDRDYGSLEPGKIADVVLYDGDPFEWTTHVDKVLMNGRLVFDRSTEPATTTALIEAAGEFHEETCCELLAR